MTLEFRNRAVCQMNKRSPAQEFIKAIENWQKQLLDFTRRNHQLYFQPEPGEKGYRGRPTTIKIKDHSPDSIIREFAKKREGQGLQFDNLEPVAKNILDADDDLTAGNDQHQDIKNHDITGDCSISDLQRRLRNLHRGQENLILSKAKIYST